MKCSYCKPDVVVEYRELKCTEHHSKHELCPNVPESVCKEALTRLATKRGFLSSVPTDELGTPSNPHVVDDGVAIKKKVGDDSGDAEVGNYGRIRGPWALKIKRDEVANQSVF